MEDAPGLATLCRLIEAEAAAGDERGRLTDAVVDALRRAGLFKAYLPADLGGLGLALPDACETIARVAHADGAAGWAVMIGAGPNWFAGHMPDALAREVFAAPDSVVAGSGATGRARAVAGGLCVDGRWPWCSGAPWATWFTFNAELPDGEIRTVAVPAGSVCVEPGTWDVRGLRATASLTAALTGVLVPDDHTFAVDERRPRRDEPIFRVPFLTFAQTTMAAVTVGLLDRALAELAALAAHKVPWGATNVLADEPIVHERFGRATAAVAAATGHLRRLTDRVWEHAVAGRPLTRDLALDVELAVRHLSAVASDVAATVWELAGMDVLARDSTLGRVVCDIGATGQNAVVSAARFGPAGAALLRRR